MSVDNFLRLDSREDTKQLNIFREFRDPIIENMFLIWNQPQRIRIFSLAVFYGSLVTLVFIIPDYFKLGLQRNFFFSLFGRLTIIGFALFLLKVIKTHNSRKFLDMVFLFISLIIILASAVIIKSVSSDPAIAGLSELLAVMVFYFFIPQRLLLTIFTGALASLIFLISHISNNNMEVNMMLAMSFSFFMVNLFGYIYVRNQNQSNRQQFSLLMAEYDARVKMESEIEERKKLEDELRIQAMIDPLTGLYNRRYFLDFAENQLNQCRRFGETFSMILYDIDDFKKVNDNFGHEEGDRVLKNISNMFKDITRKSDVVARFGGEEFVILCPHHDLESAKLLGEKIKIAVRNYKISEKTNITLSGGVAEYTGSLTIDMLIKKCDQGLYMAKKTGKNLLIALP